MIPMDSMENPWISHGKSHENPMKMALPRRCIAAARVRVLGAPDGAKGATAQNRRLWQVH